jgi:hypothetical protein
MKVAIVFATDRSSRENAVLAPFRSAGFVDGLKIDRVDPVMISVVPEHVVAPAAPGEVCRPSGLRKLIADARPDAIQTFGPEHRLAAVWRLAAEMKVPLAHCVSCWREALEDGNRQTMPLGSFVPSLAVFQARRASAHVDALLGTSRAAPGGLLADGFFPRARFSVVVPPPVERAGAGAAAAAPAGGLARPTPVFGIYDPHAAADLIAFIAHAIQLTGRPQTFDVRIATGAPPPAAPLPVAREEGRAGGAAAAPLSFTAAGPLDAFLAAIDVLAVPAYDDSIAAALIAALRAGKSVIVPDRGGAAELIEYGRHGFMFSAGSAYHFATALNIVSQSWGQRPILLADGGPAIAKTHPVAVSHSFATVHARLGPSTQAVPRIQSLPAASPTPRPAPLPRAAAALADARLRCGIVALARSDRRMMEATLQSIARLADGPEAVVLAVPKLRAHLFDDAPSDPSRPIRVVTADSADALPLADGFRALAPKVDVIVFVPEGVALGTSYLASIHESAQRWPDLVGEIGVIRRIVEDERLARTVFDSPDRQIRPAGNPRWLRPRTLFANLMWGRVEACGNLKFMAFPQSAEYLAFSSLLDQLRPRGRTRVVSCDTAVQVRPGPERRSGYEAGRELYGALSRIGEWRDRSDAAFAARSSYLDPRTEKIRLFGEQIMRYLATPAARAHIGSFIKGMWAARREAAASRHRIRDDIRNLG